MVNEHEDRNITALKKQFGFLSLIINFIEMKKITLLVLLTTLVIAGTFSSAICTKNTKDSVKKPFQITPKNIPNNGILFVNHEEKNRSGHGGHAITECKNGDIIAFYMNTWAENWGGHSCAGWSSYKRSTDGGKTWSEPIDLKYSKEVWDSPDVFSAMVFSLVTAPDGTLIATLVRFSEAKWEKQLTPVYLLSHDNGETWSDPLEIDESATVDDISLTFNASFVYDNEVFQVFMGGSEGPAVGPYTLYVSDNNGKSFSKRSTLPMNHTDYYSAASVLDNGDIIVYSYPYGDGENADEKNLPYVISKDKGYTWSDIKTAYFAKALRNPQMSEKIGDYYFIHGRSGSFGDNPDNFVLYSSKDGINWDDGIYLMSRQQTPGGGDCYSGNAIIGKYNQNSPERLLIQGDVSYNGSRVNICHWWVDVYK